MREKLYARRDTEAIGELYIKHVEAMTAEGLHQKNHIAAELAWRDSLLIEHETVRKALIEVMGLPADSTLSYAAGAVQAWAVGKRKEMGN